MKESRKRCLQTPAGKDYKRNQQREYRRRKRKIHDPNCECSMCKHYRKTGEINPLRGE